MRTRCAIVFSLVSAALGSCGGSDIPRVEETELLDAEADSNAGQDEARSRDLGDAVKRWDAGKSAGAAGEEAAACAAGGIERPLTEDEAAQLVAAAVEGLLRAPRFVERRVRSGLWEGDVLKVNAAASDPGGGRKILLGEGRLVRRIDYVDAGKTRRLSVRSSVENPQLVADGASAQRRDILLLEVAARYEVRAVETIALVDEASQLAAVVKKIAGDWCFVRAVELIGVEDSREALCRAVAAQ